MQGFTLIPLESIDRAALRLVTFASQGVAEAFVRTFVAGSENEIAFAVKSAQRGSLRNAICKVGGITKPVRIAAGETYTVKRGDNKGKRVTAKYDKRESYTASDFAAACDTLGITLTTDPTWNDPTSGDDKRVALLLAKRESETESETES